MERTSKINIGDYVSLGKSRNMLYKVQKVSKDYIWITDDEFYTKKVSKFYIEYIVFSYLDYGFIGFCNKSKEV